MSAEDIVQLPKSFLLLFAANEIDGIWMKLSDELKQDEDIAGFRRCHQHYSISNPDHHEFDGPKPFIKNCSQCQC